MSILVHIYSFSNVMNFINITTSLPYMFFITNGHLRYLVILIYVSVRCTNNSKKNTLHKNSIHEK